MSNGYVYFLYPHVNGTNMRIVSTPVESCTSYTII